MNLPTNWKETEKRLERFLVTHCGKIGTIEDDNLMRSIGYEEYEGRYWVDLDELKKFIRTDALEREERVREQNLKLVAWLLSEDTGMSSKHIVGHMLNVPVVRSQPYDKWDRARCVKLLTLIPEWADRLGEMKEYYGWEEQIGLITEALLSPSKEEEK